MGRVASKPETSQKRKQHVTCRPLLYLGPDLEEIRGRILLDDDELVEVPVVPLPGVVLFPGQTLPLYLFHPSLVAMVRQLVNSNKTFGIVTPRFNDENAESSISNIGTTAEILAYKEENDAGSGVITVRCKAIGRQRFEVKERRRQSDGLLLAKTRIRCETMLSTCLSELNIFSHGHRNIQNRNLTKACLTRWPQWVYDQYDAHCLASQVLNELVSWNNTLHPNVLPTDPVALSYWVAGNLPMDDNAKLSLLSLDCVVQRLRLELSLMQRYMALCCKNCNVFITNKSDIFCMSLTGPLGTYVNPGGHVHETITVMTADNLTLVGRSSTDNSWFPGYAWTIAQCADCSSHLGWRFTAVSKKSQPEKFWGLCRSSLLPSIVTRTTQTENEDDFSQTNTSEQSADRWVPVM